MNRNTSARAESTVPGSIFPSGATEHLRSRGEHIPHGSGRAGAAGTPPLARRARHPPRRWSAGPRNTSARAESTGCTATSPGHRAEHLRSRGEHTSTTAAQQPHLGTPPLARRALLSLYGHRSEHRNTSARAESTGRCVRGRAGTSEHLRSRGEHGGARPSSRRAAGTPPLARRAPGKPTVRLPERRNTSARAESTRTRQSAFRLIPEHLRSRGEHEREPCSRSNWNGTPPLARRAPRHPGEVGGGLGNTSARAESTKRGS